MLEPTNYETDYINNDIDFINEHIKMIFGSGNAAWHGDLTVKKMIIGKVILEVSRKNDVQNNCETAYKSSHIIVNTYQNILTHMNYF